MKYKIPNWLRPVVIIIILLPISTIVTYAIPGDITSLISDIVTIEGSGNMIVLLSVLVILFLGYKLISNSMPSDKNTLENFEIISGNKAERLKEKKNVYIYVKKYIKKDYINDFHKEYTPLKNTFGITTKLCHLRDEVRDLLLEIEQLDASDNVLLEDIRQLFMKSNKIMIEHHRMAKQENATGSRYDDINNSGLLKLHPLANEMLDKLDKKIGNMELIYGQDDNIRTNNSKDNYALFVMEYRKKTQVINNMHGSDGPIRHMIYSYHLLLIPQNDIKFAPISVQLWTKKNPKTVPVPLRLKDMGNPENGEYDIDIGKFLAHGEHEKSYAGFIHDINDAEEIIWEFAYKSMTDSYKIVRYYKWGGDFDGYVEQEFAHELESDWIIEKWQKEKSNKD